MGSIQESFRSVFYLFALCTFDGGTVHAVGCVCGGQRKILSCRLSFYLVVLGIELRPSVWVAGSSAPIEPCHWPLYSRRFYGSRLSGNIVPSKGVV